MDKSLHIPKDNQFNVDVSAISERLPAGIAMGVDAQIRKSILPILPSDVIALDQLYDSWRQLSSGCSFDVDLFDQTINQLTENEAHRTLRAEKDKAVQWINRGKVEVIDEETDEPKWINLPNAVVPKFIQAINEASLSPDEALYNQQSFTDMSEEEAGVLLGSTTFSVIEELSNLLSSLPTNEELISGNLDGLQLILEADTLNVDRDILRYSPDSPVLRAIRKKVIKLSKVIDEFANNPAVFSAKALYKKNTELIEQQISDLVRGTLLEATTETYASLDPDELKRVKQRTIEEAPKLSKRQKRRQKQLAEQAMSSTVKIDEENPLDIITEQYIDDLSLTLPWIDGGEEFTGRATELRAGSRVVYVINGMEDKLQTIANETQDKEEIASKVTNAINHQAQLLLGGYMPWERQTSTVKSLGKNGRAPKEYSSEAIWYSFDIRPNAPRVYFVVKDASEIETGDQPKLNPDAKCMVVLAITDKSQQISVLQRLTGQNRAYLVAHGAGSI